MKKPRLIITNILVFVITGLIAFVGVPYWAMTQGFDTTEIVVCGHTRPMMLTLS